MSSGEGLHLPDRQRDDLRPEHQVDRLQQQRSEVAASEMERVCVCVSQTSVCVSSGYYTHISTLADVQENVMEYLHVLSRPMVINHDHDIIWTEAYMDSVVSRPITELQRSRSWSNILCLLNILHPVFIIVITSSICLLPPLCFFIAPFSHDPLGLSIHRCAASQHQGGNEEEVLVLDERDLRVEEVTNVCKVINLYSCHLYKRL